MTSIFCELSKDFLIFEMFRISTVLLLLLVIFSLLGLNCIVDVLHFAFANGIRHLKIGVSSLQSCREKYEKALAML